MQFLAPLFLFGLWSLALPIWLHRREQRTLERQRVSSLMHFEPGQRTGRAPRRLRDLFLLALRMLLLYLACLAFAQPLLTWARLLEWLGAPALGAADAVHLIVLDGSLSMSAGERWARARAQALAVLDALPAGDFAQLVRADRGLTALGEPTRDRAVLRAGIGAAEPSSLSLAYGAAIAQLQTLADAAADAVRERGGEPRRAVAHLISDFQASGAPLRWLDRLPRGALELQLHPIAQGEANWFIEGVSVTDGERGARRIEATVRGVGTSAERRTLRARLDGKPVAEQTQLVEADGRAAFALELGELASGDHRLELALDGGDALPADDRYRRVIAQRAPARVLFASENPGGSAALYFASALAAGAGSAIALERRAARELGAVALDELRLIVLCDVLPSREVERRLREYVEAGGSVWQLLGASASRVRRLPLTQHAVSAPRAQPAEAGPLPGGIAAEGAAAVGDAAAWRDVNLFRHVGLTPREGDAVLLRTPAGAPLLLEHAIGAGRVWLQAFPLDPEWSDLPVQPLFVRFVREGSERLAGLSSEPEPSLAGESLRLGSRGPAAAGGSAVQVLDPDGARLLSLDQTRSAQDVALERPGFFTVQRSGGERPVAVNLDPAESDLRPMAEAELARWRADAAEQRGVPQGSDPAAVATATGATDEPRLPLAGGLLWMLAMAVLLEPIVSSRLLRAYSGPGATP